MARVFARPPEKFFHPRPGSAAPDGAVDTRRAAGVLTPIRFGGEGGAVRRLRRRAAWVVCADGIFS